jgi:RimJ/RimL family protein N-acetyltransferase
MFHKTNPFILTSKRLLIRPHKDGDEILLNRAISDSFELLHEWMDWAVHPQTLEESKNYVQYSQKCWSEDNPKELPLLIFDRNEGNLIGAASYNAINWSVPTVEIGYWINSRYTGQGLITEAVELLTRHAFSAWDVKRVEIRCDTENSKSAAIPKRLGFELEAHFKNHRRRLVSKELSGTLIFVLYSPDKLPDILA